MTSIQGLNRMGLAAGTVNLVCGLLVSLFSSAHLAAVTLRRVRLKIPAWVTGETHATIAGVPYDFRVYSLVLFGAVVLSCGLVIIRSSLGIARGDAAARRRALWATLIVLATVIPVIPIQDEAPLLIVPAAIGLAALLLSTRHSNVFRCITEPQASARGGFAGQALPRADRLGR